MRIPKELLTAECLEALVQEGLSVIRKDLPEAGFLARTAVSGARRLGSSHALGSSLRLAGHVALLGGRAKKALSFYREARSSFREEPIEQAATAVAMLQALAYTGEYEESFAVAQQAISVFEEAGDDYRAARVKANLGNALHRLDRLEEARAHYEDALPSLVKAGAVADLAIVARNFGVCLMGLKEFSRADSLYSEARRVFEEAGDRSLVLEVDLNRAYLLGRTGMVRDAIVACRRLRDNLPEELGFEIGHSFLDQADFLLEVGLWSDAEEAASRAASIFERLGVSFEAGKAKLLAGWALSKKGRLSEAGHLLRDARRRLRREPNAQWQSLACLAAAEQWIALGRRQSAYRDLKEAFELGPREDKSARVHDLLLDLALQNGLSSEADLLAEGASPAYRAKLRLSQGRPEEAEELGREALLRYDRERAYLGPSLLRKAAASAKESELREIFRVLRKPSERLACAARLKNQSLAEITFSPESAPPSDELRQRRSRLFSGQFSRDHDSERALESAWREARMEAESSLVETDTLPIMAPGTAFAEIFHDSGQVLVFVCRDHEVTEFVLGSLAEVQMQARLLRLHLAGKTGPRDFITPVLSWFGERLSPIIQPGRKTLYIGRDYPLSNTPLHAALVQGERLFQKLHVVYAPSASAWWAVHKRPRRKSGKPLIIGCADEKAPRIESEVRAVSEILGCKAEDPSSLESCISSAKVVHLAAHGLIREDRPLFSSILMGERSLSVFDFMQQPLSAELVTLSGCATGVAITGETNDSEGFIEAVLASGARSVLASLWDVSDEAAALWMEAFYSSWEERGSREAHRFACETVMKVFPHPSAWAPFALFGDPS